MTERATGKTPEHIGTKRNPAQAHSALLTDISLTLSVPNHGRINWVSPADANVNIFEDTSFWWFTSEVKFAFRKKS